MEKEVKATSNVEFRCQLPTTLNLNTSERYKTQTHYLSQTQGTVPKCNEPTQQLKVFHSFIQLILEWKTAKCTCVWYSESGLSSASSLESPKSDTLHDMFSPTRTLRAARSLMKRRTVLSPAVSVDRPLLKVV